MTHSIEEHADALCKVFYQRMNESGIGATAVPSSLIYHYTTAAGLRGILEQRHIFATHFQYLNDLSEMKYGREFSDEFLRTRLEDERLPLLEGALAIIADSSQVDLAERYVRMVREERKAFLLINEAVKHIDTSVKQTYYITSFCESGDRLSQWRGYANRGGGYAIGFEVKTSQIVSDKGTFFALKVLYDRRDQRKLLDTLLADAIKSVNSFAISIDDKSQYDLVIGAHVGTLLQFFDLVCIRFKNDSFSEEKEWRFFSGIDAGSVEAVKFRDANGLVIPYLEFPITAEGIEIKRIVCGPTLQPELSRRSVEMLARKNGFGSVEIAHSKIPLGLF